MKGANVLEYITHPIFFIWLLMIVTLISTISMFVILLIKGDERKKYILSKDIKSSIIGLLISIICTIMYDIIFEQYLGSGITKNPIIYVFVMSLIFNVSYFIFKRKYGD